MQQFLRSVLIVVMLIGIYIAVQPESPIASNDENLVKAQFKSKHSAVIAARESVKVKLLSGVHAPTDGTNRPVVFKLISDIYRPDGSAIPIVESRIIAQSQGSIADSRAIFRLEELVFRQQDGSIKTVDIDGWIVDEEGKRGMKGRVIDPLGSILSTADCNNCDPVTSPICKILPKGVCNYCTPDCEAYYAYLSDYRKERAEDLPPYVKVLSGSQATAVFSKKIEIESLLGSH